MTKNNVLTFNEKYVIELFCKNILILFQLLFISGECLLKDFWKSLQCLCKVKIVFHKYVFLRKAENYFCFLLQGSNSSHKWHKKSDSVEIQSLIWCHMSNEEGYGFSLSVKLVVFLWTLITICTHLMTSIELLKNNV